LLISKRDGVHRLILELVISCCVHGNLIIAEASRGEVLGVVPATLSSCDIACASWSALELIAELVCLEQIIKGTIRDVGLNWETSHVPTGVSENKKENEDGDNDEKVGTAKLHLVSTDIFL
jgi:hypothetical protein